MAPRGSGTLAAVVLFAAALGMNAKVVFAQSPATLPAAETSLVSLNFPENVDLKTLVDYVSERLRLNIIYQDEQLSNQHVTIKSPTRIPATALKGLLEDLLKSKGFALTDADGRGFLRVVSIPGSATAATQPAAPADRVVAQTFPLRFLDAQRADQIIKPFLSGTTAASMGLPEQHMVLVTDFASNLERVAQILSMIDRPNPNLRVEFLPVKNADAVQLAQEVKQILAARAKAQLMPGQPAENVDVAEDRRSGQIVIVGSSASIEEGIRAVHALDMPVTEQQSPIRFYKLANATAADVLETLRALEGEEGSTPARQPAPARSAAIGQNTNLAAGNLPRGIIPAGNTAMIGAAFGGGNGLSPYAEDRAAQSGFAAPQPGAPGPTESTTPAVPAGLRTRNATVAADPNTNTIIVVAEPSVQRLYEQLIKALDKRRPQVLIEATVVTLDTSHNFTFGVEFGGRTKGSTKAISFSSFGLSTPDPATGQLALVPGAGFNGTVIGSDLAQVVLRALAGSTRAKVTSAPRILVNDNATGTLSSLTEEPYTTTAIGTTIATTTFGGYAQAGTQVVLTPHISESDYLQLEYQVSLSSFTGAGDPTHGIPPGIEQDSVQSKVTIPDGSTVIVGGLNRTNINRTIQSIPLLDQIPILKYVFGRHDDTDERITLFVFLRPIILRDDQFEDLKFLSARDLKVAGIPAGMPSSDPLPIR